MANLKTTASLAAAVAVCGLLLWTMDRRHHDVGGLDAGGTVGRVFPRGLDDVDSIIVERGSFRTTLRQQGGRWQQIEPFAAEVDQTAVRKFFDALADAPLLERITLDELRRRELGLNDFGLAPAQTRVVVRTASRRIEVGFGRLTPGSNEVYCYLDTASQVLVTSRSVLDAIPVSAASLLERSLLRAGGPPVMALELRRAGMPYVKLVRIGGVWQMAQPVSAPADESVVDAMLAGLRKARIESFVWPPAGISEPLPGGLRSRLPLYGLDAESAVQVQLWDVGGPVGVRLRFGKPVEDHAGWVYALTADEQGVVAVTNAVLSALMATPADLRDRRIFPSFSEEIVRFNLRFAEQLVECRSDRKQNWTMVSPVQDAADQEQVTRFLRGLLRLRAERVMENPPASSASITMEQGAPTNVVCVVELASTSRVSRLAIAPSATPGCMEITFTNLPVRYVVATSNLPPVVLSPVAAYSLHEHMVLALATSTVRRVCVQRGNEVEEIERVPEGEAWQVTGAPAGKTVTTESLSAWMALLLGLPSARIEQLGFSEHDNATFGFDNPWMQIRLDVLSADAVRKIVIVGRTSPDGGRYAMLRGHEAIFVLGPETLRVLGLKLVQTVSIPAPAGDDKKTP